LFFYKCPANRQDLPDILLLNPAFEKKVTKNKKNGDKADFFFVTISLQN